MAFLPLDVLRSGALDLGIGLAQAQLEQLDRFASLLVETNRTLNLTRITDPPEIVTGHYLDSLTCLAAVRLPDGARCIDVGTGAGFPGIPVAIARPDLRVVLMDSSRKKLGFIAAAAEEIGLTNTETLHARAEEVGRDPAHRERYDIAFARALSELKVLAELCLPLVRVDGRVIAQKSAEIEEELAQARPVIGQLGGVVESVTEQVVPGTRIVRRLVVMRKTRPTPERFPRPYARIVRGKSGRAAGSTRG